MTMEPETSPETREENTTREVSVYKAVHNADKEFKPTNRLLNRALAYHYRARRELRKGRNPLEHARTREEAGKLLSFARKWYSWWTYWRNLKGVPPTDHVPAGPAKTRYGAVIRAAKAYGYCLRTGGDVHAAAMELLRAADNLSPYPEKNWQVSKEPDQKE